ncbi:MAG: lytic murein transglycosylase [Bauldia sp.]
MQTSSLSMATIRLAALLAFAGPPAAEAAPAAPAPDPFVACLKSLRASATAAGIAGTVFDTAMAGAKADPSVLRSAETQPEFKTAIWDYMALIVNDDRVAEGRARLKAMAAELDAAERRFGVEPAVVVAIWGAESNFGKAMGNRPLLQSLATLSCEGRRQSYFRSEFVKALKIVARGDIKATDLVGSWAGAFGQTQFMPSNYWEDAVDHDGDGKVDLIGSAADALGSAANELKHSGWVAGLPWGFEVKLPPRFDASYAGRRAKRPYEEWTGLGVRLANGGALPASGSAGLLIPAGVNGPAFLVTRNFDAIFAYNPAEAYALAIAHLADRVKGGGPLVTRWPIADRALSPKEIMELQTLLIGLGYDIGNADGVPGDKTRKAVQDFQQKRGLEPDGRPSESILLALRSPGAATPARPATPPRATPAPKPAAAAVPAPTSTAAQPGGQTIDDIIRRSLAPRADGDG